MYMKLTGEHNTDSKLWHNLLCTLRIQIQ